MNDDFDLSGLREHVERRDRFDSKSFLQFAKIARERGRIARNINYGCRCKIDNSLAGYSPQDLSPEDRQSEPFLPGFCLRANYGVR